MFPELEGVTRQLWCFLCCTPSTLSHNIMVDMTDQIINETTLPESGVDTPTSVHSRNDPTSSRAHLTHLQTICPEWANLKPPKTTVVLQVTVTHSSVINHRAPTDDIQVKFRRDMPLGVLVKRLRRRYHSSQDHVLRWADLSRELEIFDSDTPDMVSFYILYGVWRGLCLLILFVLWVD